MLTFGSNSARGQFVRDGSTLNDIFPLIFYIYLWVHVEGIFVHFYFFAYSYLFLFVLYKMSADTFGQRQNGAPSQFPFRVRRSI